MLAESDTRHSVEAARPRKTANADVSTLADWTARVRPLLGVAVLYLVLAALVRVGLIAVFGLRAGVSWTEMPAILGAGAINDAVVALYFLLPAHLYLALVPERLYRTRLQRVLTFLVVSLLAFLCLYGAAVAYFFFEEFDSRLNLVAVDYLLYPHEVLINIWDSYPVVPVVAISIALALGLGALVWRRWAPPARPRVLLRRRSALLGAHVLVVCLFGALYPTRTLARFDNRVANELEINGLSSFFEALRTNRLEYDTYYLTDEPTKLVGLLEEDLERGGTRARADGERVKRTFPGHQPRERATHPLLTDDPEGDPVNVVLLVEESLGAEFLGAYGDERGLSPEVDELATEGLLARHAYATGTRTVRGLEAIVTSFPPIPSVSILKRPGNEHIANLGAILRDRGYRTSFLYGGYAYFDNMEAFFEGNDYEVSDRTEIEDPIFANIWGVSDQDLFRHAIATFDRYAEDGRPFFSVVLSTSNHKPFTFPAGIPGIPEEGGGRLAGIRYADHALGELFREARDHPWFDDTLFVIVGDHGARVYGAADIPLPSYEIPILFLAPSRLEPGTIDTLASQLDIAPTILGMLGEPFEAPFYGQDLLALDPDQPRSLLLNHNHDVGLLRGDEMVVLGLHQTVSGFVWDAEKKTLTPSDANPMLAELATAYYQVAYDQFRDGLYR